MSKMQFQPVANVKIYEIFLRSFFFFLFFSLYDFEILYVFYTHSTPEVGLAVSRAQEPWLPTTAALNHIVLDG